MQLRTVRALVPSSGMRRDVPWRTSQSRSRHALGAPSIADGAEAGRSGAGLLESWRGAGWSPCGAPAAGAPAPAPALAPKCETVVNTPAGVPSDHVTSPLAGAAAALKAPVVGSMRAWPPPESVT